MDLEKEMEEIVSEITKRDKTFLPNMDKLRDVVFECAKENILFHEIHKEGERYIVEYPDLGYSLTLLKDRMFKTFTNYTFSNLTKEQCSELYRIVEDRHKKSQENGWDKVPSVKEFRNGKEVVHEEVSYKDYPKPEDIPQDKKMRDLFLCKEMLEYNLTCLQERSLAKAIKLAFSQI